MDDSFRNSRDTLPLAAERRIDQVCLEFENAWKSGAPPQIEQYLGTTPRPERDRLLRELLLLELDYRGQAAEQPAAEEYHGRFPDDAGLIEEVFQSSSGSSNDPASGTRVRYFGDYELLEKIARGGMGIVYKARQLSLNRVVALKLVLAGQFASEEEVERFHREAEAAANLQHPNIVPIYEVGQHDDQPYFSMAYVEGRSLGEVIRQHPLPGVQAARYVGAVARAVEYAHQEGTLHRDLKPANILIDRNDQPQITDFGLAKRVDVDSDLTQSGQVLGSPSYMPPEQASAKHGEVGPASDVYALGAILYELLTGRPPFKAETATDTLLQVLSNEPVSPRELNLKVPRDLETICLMCLEKDPSRRYASAVALADDLDRFLHGEPIRARPSSKLGRAWRWCKRNPVISSLAVGLVVVLLAGMVGVTWQWKTADGARKEAEEEAGRRRRLQYVSEMVMAEQAWEAGNVTAAEELLQRHRPRPNEEDLRGFHWHYLNQSCERSKDTITLLHKAKVWSAAISRNGKTVAAGGLSPSVPLWDSKTKTLVRTLVDPPNAWVVRFLPDSGALLTVGSQWIRRWNPATGQLDGKWPNMETTVRGAISRDGKWLVLGGFLRTVWLWNLVEMDQPRAFRGHELQVFSVGVSPDGKLVAAASLAKVLVWETEGSGEPFVLDQTVACGNCVAFSPDGKTIATGGRDGRVWLWNVTTRQLVGELHSRVDSPAFSVAFSSDGRLAAGLQNGQVVVWDVAAKVEIDVLKGHRQTVWDVTFSRDNTALVSGSTDKTVRVWNVAGRCPPDLLQDLPGHVTAMVFTPDCSALATAGTDFIVRLWDAETGEQLTALPAHRSHVEHLAISSDSENLASVSFDNTVRLWSFTSGSQTGSIDQDLPRAAVFTPDSRRLAVGGAGMSMSPRLRDASSGATLRKYEGHQQQVLAVAISPDGRTLASGSWDTTVRLWDVETGVEVHCLEGHRGDVNSLAFSPDGKLLASGATDGMVKLWDVAAGVELQTLDVHGASVNSVAFSPDGRILASGGDDNAIKLWYYNEDREPESLTEESPVVSVCFSAGGATLVAAAGNSVRFRRTIAQGPSYRLRAMADLERRARVIADTDPEGQAQIIDDLRRHLGASVEEGLLSRDIILATSTAWRLHRRGQRELAAKAFRSFAEPLIESKSQNARRLAETWRETARQFTPMAADLGQGNAVGTAVAGGLYRVPRCLNR